MWNVPTQSRLAKIPQLYATEGQPLLDKMIHLHFFIGGCDWYIAEYDGEETFFGYAILHGDLDNAEWGYVSFEELKALKVQGWLEVDCELEDFWTLKKAGDIANIRAASSKM